MKEMETVLIDEDKARRFLDKLKRVLLDKYSCDEIKSILRRRKPALVALTNCDAKIRFRDLKETLDFFGHHVTSRVENVSGMSLAGSLLQCIDQTDNGASE
eukprot:GFKZ01005056.1.p1 GENE.GFKZ01005056.1~~GFKZ01005056.1.p1  ORF type:complete len:101 (+),score=16.35 GFKZ01005056.1:561-863(+)